MIELPDFTKPFYYENNFYLSSDIYRLAKVMAHYELFKMTVDVPGAIVECGVFKGAAFVRFAAFRELLCNPAAKKMIGFDAFGPFPETDFKEDKKWREKFISDSGDEGIGEDQLMEVLKHKKTDSNIELIKGDVCKTLPSYVEKHPELKISFLNIDVDVYEPTKAVLDNLYGRVSKGGVILLDDYANVFPGANKAIDDFFKGKNVEIKRLPFAITPCYIVKNEF
jgi:hypothetical protein